MVKLHRAVAVRTLDHVRKLDRLVGSVCAYTGFGTLAFRYRHGLSQHLS